MLAFDPALDLRFDRRVDLPPEALWRGWTTPALLMQWFCPRPWSVVECDIDLRPGGAFRTVMQSPEGQRFPGLGCYLELQPEGDGTRYTAQVMHADTAARDRHAAMGFETGWGLALDQLVALLRTA